MQREVKKCASSGDKWVPGAGRGQGEVPGGQSGVGNSQDPEYRKP